MAKKSRKKEIKNVTNLFEGAEKYGLNDKRDQRYTKNVKPRSIGQQKFMQAMDSHSLTMALGPAGTGKTYLAIAKAVEYFENGKVDRIILSRPAIEAGESLGYLPGDFLDKMAPYLRPLYDALTDRMGAKQLKNYITNGDIEIAPIGYMRGRTLNNAFVVIDEAQNCTYAQIKMCVSRLGWNSIMVITGDPDQSDLLEGISGLAEVARRLEPIDNLSIIHLAEEDIVRHPLVAEMLGFL